MYQKEYKRSRVFNMRILYRAASSVEMTWGSHGLLTILVPFMRMCISAKYILLFSRWSRRFSWYNMGTGWQVFELPRLLQSFTSYIQHKFVGLWKFGGWQTYPNMNAPELILPLWIVYHKRPFQYYRQDIFPDYIFRQVAGLYQAHPAAGLLVAGFESRRCHSCHINRGLLRLEVKNP